MSSEPSALDGVQERGRGLDGITVGEPEHAIIAGYEHRLFGIRERQEVVAIGVGGAPRWVDGIGSARARRDPLDSAL